MNLYVLDVDTSDLPDGNESLEESLNFSISLEGDRVLSCAM